jgi:drug/metabolite transporter (DMT)-like permease
MSESPASTWPEPAAERARLAGGVLRVLIAASALGTLGPVAGLAYDAGAQPATFSALRAAVGAAVLGLLLITGGQPRVRLATLPRRQLAMLALAVAVNGVMNLMLFLAFGAMTVALVMVIFFTYPVQVALMAVALRRERLTRRRVAALALAASGLALVLGSRLGPDTQATLAGVLLASGAAVCHAVYLIAVRDGFPRVPPVQATSLVLAGGVVVSGTAAIIAGGPGLVGPWASSPVAWAAILFAGTMGAAFPKVWVMAGVRAIGSTRAAVLMLMEPVTAVVVAAVVLAQSPTPTEVLGGGAVLLAVLVVQRHDPSAEVSRAGAGAGAGAGARESIGGSRVGAGARAKGGPG